MVIPFYLASHRVRVEFDPLHSKSNEKKIVVCDTGNERMLIKKILLAMITSLNNDKWLINEIEASFSGAK